MKPWLFLSIIGMLDTSSSALSLIELKLNETKSTKDVGQLTESGQRVASATRQVGQEVSKVVDLCGNTNNDDGQCLMVCVSGGFYDGICSSDKDCFCYYQNNPDKGFIIERKQPVLRRVKTKNSNQKQISIETDDDFMSGHMDVDINLNLNWDLSSVNEWFQSFYTQLECDPCLCPTGCAVRGYYTGFCSPRPSSKCICATASNKPK